LVGWLLLLLLLLLLFVVVVVVVVWILISHLLERPPPRTNPLRPAISVEKMTNADARRRREKQQSPDYLLYRAEMQRCIVLKGLPAGRMRGFVLFCFIFPPSFC
jgi:hypothetical protein